MSRQNRNVGKSTILNCIKVLAPDIAKGTKQQIVINANKTILTLDLNFLSFSILNILNNWCYVKLISSLCVIADMMKQST